MAGPGLNPACFSRLSSYSVISCSSAPPCGRAASFSAMFLGVTPALSARLMSAWNSYMSSLVMSSKPFSTASCSAVRPVEPWRERAHSGEAEPGGRAATAGGAPTGR